jgi:hypothetical protein
MAYKAGKSPPEYWRNLGSSKTRTKEQEIKGTDIEVGVGDHGNQIDNGLLNRLIISDR